MFEPLVVAFDNFINNLLYIAYMWYYSFKQTEYGTIYNLKSCFLTAFPTVACGDSLDWKELTAEEIAERVLSKVKPGSVMLFHNGVKNTPDALDKILKKLTDDGYKVVKASDMIYKENYTIDHTGKQVKN